MATQPQPQAETVWNESEQPRWTLVSRIAFRFCFVYFGLYCLTNQIVLGLFPIPGIDYVSDPSSFAPIRQTVFWTAKHVFHVFSPLVYQGSGSGDKTFDWVLVFCVLCIALIATAAWSVLDGRRTNYVTLHKWVDLFLRFAVGSEMVWYGMSKVVPIQMPFPLLLTLLEPYGNFSPMGVLWSSIGASPAYERFVGSAEMLGGILLFIPRTATVGALVCLADATEVFMLNMTYDVPVKLLSFHLILMSLVLLAPELPRIGRFFFSNREVGQSTHSRLFRNPRANRIAMTVQILFGLLLIAGHGFDKRKTWYSRGDGARKSSLYGIWNVDQLLMDGALRPALITDNDRWRRVIFDGPQGLDLVTFQRMDDTFVNYRASVKAKGGSIALTKATDNNWRSSLTFQRPSHDQLMLDGEMDGHRLHMKLQLVDRSKLLLVNRGFRWVQEYPFNR